MKTLQVNVSAAGVATVEMARPKVFNAFDEVMIEELDQTFTQLADDSQVRVIVLSGQGKAFSAGADINWMQRASQASQEQNVIDARQFSGMYQRIYSSPKPTIARVQGLALGGGVGLTCACDIAIAASNARFSVSEAKFGILPAVIGTYLVTAVGVRQARRLALTTERIDAQEALRIGLVNQVVDVPLLDAAVDATVREIMNGGPEALAEIKKLYDQLRPGDVSEAARELCAQAISRVRGGAEAKEGFAAFLAKRPANWVQQK